MMQKYDEYQKLKRHKNGYYIFTACLFLIIINSVFPAFWGETKQAESVFLATFAYLLFLLVSIFTNSYFTPKEQRKKGATYFGLLFNGVFWLWLVWESSFSENSFYNPKGLLVNGKVSEDAGAKLAWISWILVPLAAGIQLLIEWYMNRKESKEEI